VWVDVGAGTARNLEFFPVETLKSRFSKIYILDISPSLLEVARKRVVAAGLQDVVELVLADFTDLSPRGRAALPAAGSADLVTFSYSLSMIPDKTAALRQACTLLRPGGALALADFFARGETSLTAKPLTMYFAKSYDYFCRIWFKQDGVHLLRDSIFNAVEPDTITYVHGERFRGAVPLVPFLRPWHGIWIALKGDDDTA
jgi:S-adenosylmethionine-diacylgycerolhomoserine-N-methlytransferase